MTRLPRRRERTQSEQADRRAKLKKWAPSGKWWTATVIAAGAIVQMLWLGDGIDTDPEKTVLVTIVVQRVAAYIARN